MEILFTDGRRENHGRKTDLVKLNLLQKIVGGYIEVLRLDHEHFIIFNEDGNMKNMPINITATNICHEAKIIWHDDCIVGDAVILHNTEFD